LTRERHWAATTPSAPIAYTTQTHLAVVTNTENMSFRTGEVFSDSIQYGARYSTCNMAMKFTLKRQKHSLLRHEVRACHSTEVI
jgi:hypothetical protein